MREKHFTKATPMTHISTTCTMTKKLPCTPGNPWAKTKLNKLYEFHNCPGVKELSEVTVGDRNGLENETMFMMGLKISDFFHVMGPQTSNFGKN